MPKDTGINPLELEDDERLAYNHKRGLVIIKVDPLLEILYKLRPKLYGRNETGKERVEAVKAAAEQINTHLYKEVRAVISQIEADLGLDVESFGAIPVERVSQVLAAAQRKYGGKDE